MVVDTSNPYFIKRLSSEDKSIDSVTFCPHVKYAIFYSFEITKRHDANFMKKGQRIGKYGSL